MLQFDLFLILFGIVAIISLLFQRSLFPLPLFLLTIGMLLSALPFIPRISFNPDLVLNIFLPLLIYDMTSDTGWKEIKTNLHPILLLSVGHVIFITVILAVTIHTILPELGWPIAFIIGAAAAPPDDVAIIPLIEKGYFPQRLSMILKSEALFNDSTALIVFRFSLLALLTNQFSILLSTMNLFVLVFAETTYGIILGFFLGYLRSRIREPRIQVITSLLSPFIAYLPAVHMGGCGVLSTAVMGIVIRHRFLHDFSPEARLVSSSVWTSLSFAIQGILFLLVGLDLKFILNGIATIPWQNLVFYASITIMTVILGRFFWVFLTMHRSVQNKRAPLSWRYLFILSWAGMRGSISLAAVLTVPHLSLYWLGANVRDLIIFLIFSLILGTLLLQGLTLPWLCKKIDLAHFRDLEQEEARQLELQARAKIATSVLNWLREYEKNFPKDSLQHENILFYQKKYRLLLKQYKKQMLPNIMVESEGFLLAEMILKLESKELNRLWHQEHIPHAVRNKLLLELDYRAKKFL